MVIRLATKEDLEGMSKVHVDSWKTTYKEIIPDKVINNLSYTKSCNMWEGCLSNEDNFIFVAEDFEKGIIGFACGHKNRDHEYQYDAEISAIYILEAFQHRGIGTSLLKAICNKLNSFGYNSMIIWVLADNSSRIFYEKLGGVIKEGKTLIIGDKKFNTLGMVFSDITKI